MARESARQHFVFDLLGDSCPELEKDGRYYDFLETSLSFSYDSLEDFHRFLTEGYSYAKAGSQLVEAYCLYTLLSDGLTSLAGEELEGALKFAAEYGLPGEKSQVLENILSQRECLLELEAPLLLKAARFSMGLYSVVDEGFAPKSESCLWTGCCGIFCTAKRERRAFWPSIRRWTPFARGAGSPWLPS